MLVERGREVRLRRDGGGGCILGDRRRRERWRRCSPWPTAARTPPPPLLRNDFHMYARVYLYVWCVLLCVLFVPVAGGAV